MWSGHLCLPARPSRRAYPLPNALGGEGMRLLRVVTVLMVLALLLGPRAVHSAATPTLTPAFDADFSTLEPAIGYDPFSWTGEHAIVDALLSYRNAAGLAGTQLVPDLAASPADQPRPCLCQHPGHALRLGRAARGGGAGGQELGGPSGRHRPLHAAVLAARPPDDPGGQPQPLRSQAARASSTCPATWSPAPTTWHCAPGGTPGSSSPPRTSPSSIWP
jgi:hypothetical protein